MIMKKYLLILATCALFTSCQWYYENIAATEDCAEWYCEELYEAAKDCDVDDFREVYFDLFEWIDSLDESEKEYAKEVIDNWTESNEFKKDVVDDFWDKHSDEIPH